MENMITVSRRERVSPLGVVVGGLVCLGLVAGTVSPTWGAEGGGEGTGSVVVGAFGLGDGLEGTINEQDGSFVFSLSAGGVQLGWDSRAFGSNRAGIGYGWGFGLAHVQTEGGVQVTTPSTGKTFPLDPTHPSGLAGYGVRDVVFEQVEGRLPVRAVDAGAGVPVPDDAGAAYAFTLEELGGTVTYYNADGDPVARITAQGEQTDWVWDDLVPNRLVAVINPDGVVTTLDWESEPGTVVIAQGANLPGELDPVTEQPGGVPVWRVELDGGRVSRVIDAAGGVVTVDYDETTGLLSSLTGASGGTTEVAWRAYDDGTVRAAVVRRVDAAGMELSRREWAPAGERTSSGWPDYDGDGGLFWSGDPAFRYETVVTDGSTKVVSEYNSLHTLVSRRMIGRTASGEHELQQQLFDYPGTEDGGVPDPDALPGNWSRPIETATTYRDLRGGARTTTESFAFDEYGRQISHTMADGTVTVTQYDADVPDGANLSIGLATTETVTAPDGLVEQTRHTLNDEHTAIVVTETHAGRVGEDLTKTGHREFDVAPDGVITAERDYPYGDETKTPVITRHDRVVDLGTGTLIATETRAAGTGVEAVTVEVTSLRHGGVLAETDPVGNTTRTGHDLIGRPTVQVVPSGLVFTSDTETAQHHGRNATTTTAPDGVITTEVRDPLGRMIQTLDNIDHGRPGDEVARVVETRAYPEPGTTVITDAWGATTRTRQDVFGRVIETTGPTGLVEVTEHDDVANTVTTGLSPTGKLADAETIRIEHRDTANRPTTGTGTRTDGIPVPETRTGYDGFGRPTHAADDRLATEITHDLFGNPTTTTMTPTGTTDPLTATRRFDGFGESLEKTLTADGHERSGGERTLDELGRTQTETDPLGRTTTTTYTPDGLPDTITVSTGQTTRHHYDQHTRNLVDTVVSSPIGDEVRTRYDLDPITAMPVGVFDPADRDGTEIRTEYDAHRNPLRVDYPDGKVVEFAYDVHGRRIGITDVAGNTTTLDTTPDGLLARAVQTDPAGAPIADVAYAHDVYGRATTVRRSNGVTTEHTFTSTSQIASETSTDRDGHVITERVYEYDPRDNLTTRTDLVHTPDEQPETTITEYTYDAYDRLTGSSTRTGDRVAERTEYDLSVSGDIRSETVTTDAGTAEEVSTERQYEYGPTGELVAMLSRVDAGAAERQEQVYDAAGNLTVAFDGTRYEYDARNRPVTEVSADGATVSTDYWADGSRRRHSIVHGDATTVTDFYWDGATLVNDVHAVDDAGFVDPAATGTAAYLIAGPRLARITTDAAGTVAPTWYGTDRHGNITELLTADGRLTARYTYTDYGLREFIPVDPPAPATRNGLARNPFGYAGEYTDRRGTQHLHTRTYDPELHRFTTLDSEDLHNLYAFADLNPITKLDPTGRNGEWDWLMGLNVALFALSVALTFVNAATIVAVASLAARISTMAASLGAAEGVKLSTWALLGFGLFMDFGSTAVSGVAVYDDHFEPILDDERVKTGVAVLEGAAAISAAVLTAFAVKAVTKTAKSMMRLQPGVEAAVQKQNLTTNEFITKTDKLNTEVIEYFEATKTQQSDNVQSAIEKYKTAYNDLLTEMGRTKPKKLAVLGASGDVGGQLWVMKGGTVTDEVTARIDELVGVLDSLQVWAATLKQ